MSQLNLYPNASTIDAVNDELVIWTNSLSVVQNINRNTLLNLSSQPVGLTDSQTLTNKTLTTPTVSSPTFSGTLAGTYTIGGTPTFPASVTQNTVSQTLTNKTLTSPTITSPTITNATISADAVTGYTLANSGTIYGVPITTGVINSAGTINGASLVASSVATASIADGAITPAKLLAGTGTSWATSTWTPTLTGFSVNPTSTAYRYTQIGKIVTIFVTQGANGTSNATTFTISLPVTARTATNYDYMTTVPQLVDNTAVPTTPGIAQITSGGTVVTLYKDSLGSGWTAAGGKRAANFTISYEAA